MHRHSFYNEDVTAYIMLFAQTFFQVGQLSLSAVNAQLHSHKI